MSGHLDSEHSWLFNNKGIMKVRCAGQLILLEVFEECMLQGYEGIQLNTDGATFEIEESQLETFKQIVETKEKKFNVKFEYAFYEKMIFAGVNDYMAMEEGVEGVKGKVKEKGLFVRNPELGNSTDFLIIPNLLHDYFVKGINPEEAIYTYKNIYLFCASQKVDKSYTIEWNGKLP